MNFFLERRATPCLKKKNGDFKHKENINSIKREQNEGQKTERHITYSVHYFYR